MSSTIVFCHPSGEIYLTSRSDHTITKITHNFSKVELIAGVEGQKGNCHSPNLLCSPAGFYVTRLGNDRDIFVCDLGSHCIKRIRDGKITLFAGNGDSRFVQSGNLLESNVIAPLSISMNNTETLMCVSSFLDPVLYCIDMASSVLQRIKTPQATYLNWISFSPTSSQLYASLDGAIVNADMILYDSTQAPITMKIVRTVSGLITRTPPATKSTDPQWTRVCGSLTDTGDADGHALNARFSTIEFFCCEQDGSMLILDSRNRKIKRYDAASQFVSTVMTFDATKEVPTSIGVLKDQIVCTSKALAHSVIPCQDYSSLSSTSLTSDESISLINDTDICEPCTGTITEPSLANVTATPEETPNLTKVSPPMIDIADSQSLRVPNNPSAITNPPIYDTDLSNDKKTMPFPPDPASHNDEDEEGTLLVWPRVRQLASPDTSLTPCPAQLTESSSSSSDPLVPNDHSMTQDYVLPSITANTTQVTFQHDTISNSIEWQTTPPIYEEGESPTAPIIIEEPRFAPVLTSTYPSFVPAPLFSIFPLPSHNSSLNSNIQPNNGPPTVTNIENWHRNIFSYGSVSLSDDRIRAYIPAFHQQGVFSEELWILAGPEHKEELETKLGISKLVDQNIIWKKLQELRKGSS